MNDGERVLPLALAPIGRLLEPLYRAGVARRNAAFDRGRRVRRMPLPVVSVGNLSVGGSGKTPMCVWLIETLLAAGRRPAIAMRGYGARAGEASDEQAELTERLPGTPILANPDRASAILDAVSRDPTIDCVALDDGLQHRFVARDLDIVLIDCTRSPFEARCLPAGRLREPPTGLARAGALVLTHAESARGRVDDILGRAVRIAPSAVVAVARHEWSAIRTPSGEEPVGSLRGLRVLVSCAIGNPRPFVEQAERAGAIVAGEVLRRDHASYDAVAVRSILDRARALRCDAVLTTGKDWVKVRSLVGPAGGGAPPFLVPRMRIAFTEGEGALREAALRACYARGS